MRIKNNIFLIAFLTKTMIFIMNVYLTPVTLVDRDEKIDRG